MITTFDPKMVQYQTDLIKWYTVILLLLLLFYGLYTVNWDQFTALWGNKYRTSQPIRHTVIFSLEILEKNNDEYILILVIYWKKTGLFHTKISNHNIIYSSAKPRKSSSLPLKSSSWLFSLDAGTGIYKFGNYPQHIRRRSNLGHIFREKKVRLMGWEIQ